MPGWAPGVWRAAAQRWKHQALRSHCFWELLLEASFPIWFSPVLPTTVSDLIVLIQISFLLKLDRADSVVYPKN